MGPVVLGCSGDSLRMVQGSPRGRCPGPGGCRWPQGTGNSLGVALPHPQQQQGGGNHMKGGNRGGCCAGELTQHALAPEGPHPAPSPTSDGAGTEHGDAASSPTCRAHRFCPPELSLCDNPGARPVPCDRLPSPLPSTSKLGAVGAVTPCSHSRYQLQFPSSISPITLRVVMDTDPTAWRAEEPQILSAAQWGAREPWSRRAPRGDSPTEGAGDATDSPGCYRWEGNFPLP